MLLLGFLGGSDGKETACNEGELGSIPGLGSSPGGGHGNPLLYPCLENPMGRGAWQAAVHGIAKVGHYWATKHSTSVGKKKEKKSVIAVEYLA